MVKFSERFETVKKSSIPPFRGIANEELRAVGLTIDLAFSKPAERLVDSMQPVPVEGFQNTGQL